MKLLLITRKYPPSVGGMELFAYDLANALAAKVDVRLVKWGRPGRIRAVLIALPYLAIKSFVVLLKGGIDVIQAQDGVLAPLGYVLSKLFRKPYVVVIHGLDATYQNPLFRAIVPAAVRRANAVFCISSAAANEVKTLGVPEDKIHTIPLAVDDKLYGRSSRAVLLKKLQLPDDSQILVTVGRLVKRKGVAWFVDKVLPDLIKDYPDLIYLVVGEGSNRTNIEAAIKRHQLQDHVRLLGRVGDDLYAAVYNGADIFAMPNINVPGDMEGFGLVLLEAALCELPIVAADTEGIRDAVGDNQNGRLVPVEDVAAFQAALRQFLNDPVKAKQFGQKSRQYTMHSYQWAKVADRYVAVYRVLSE